MATPMILAVVMMLSFHERAYPPLRGGALPDDYRRWLFLLIVGSLSLHYDDNADNEGRGDLANALGSREAAPRGGERGHRQSADRSEEHDRCERRPVPEARGRDQAAQGLDEREGLGRCGAHRAQRFQGGRVESPEDGP